jgi:hypothetical protein
VLSIYFYYVIVKKAKNSSAALTPESAQNIVAKIPKIYQRSSQSAIKQSDETPHQIPVVGF